MKLNIKTAQNLQKRAKKEFIQIKKERIKAMRHTPPTLILSFFNY